MSVTVGKKNVIAKNNHIASVLIINQYRVLKEQITSQNITDMGLLY